MSEQEIREGMLLAVWDEPPLDFDPDTLMRRVEQKKSRRRALVTVGVATAMIVVSAFALPGLLPRGDDSQLASESPTSSSAPTESADMKAQRIGDKLTESLRLRTPSWKDFYSSFQPGRLVYPPSVSSAPRRPSDPELSGFVYFTDSIGPTALTVVAMKQEQANDPKTFCEGAGVCHDVRQKDGSTVTEAEYNDGSTDVQRALVVRRFESGYTVTISSYAYNPSNGAGPRQTVPLRVLALTQLVTDPSIVWE